MINATLVVQIINFFVAYIVIDRFFLRNVVNVIQQENHHHESLAASIELEKNNLLIRQRVKEDAWMNYRQLFSQHIPAIKTPLKTLNLYQDEHRKGLVLTEAEKAKLIATIKNYLYKKVQNVN